MNDETVRIRPAGDIRRRRGVIATAVAIAIGATMLSTAPVSAASESASPASASAGVDTAGVEQVLRAAGVVADAPAGATTAAPNGVAPNGGGTAGGGTDSALSAAEQAGAQITTATVTVKAGLSVTAGSSVVRMRPVVGAAPSGAATGGAALSPSGLAVFGNGADSAFALSTAKTGANAGYVVIAAATAPTAYQFHLTVDGRPAGLRLAAGGVVDVLDGAGTVVNSLAPAWAKGADGSEIATSYSVAGNILTQTVQHHGASYPVVADPLIRCDGLWCTALLSRAETRQVASGSFAPGALCAWFGPVGRLCSTLILGGWAHANVALSRGMCSAFRVWQQNLVSWPHLAYVSCYA